MSVHDELGKRMKTFYEQIPKYKLMRRTPVIIRIDGKAFHTFTKGFQKPFDHILMKSMQDTMKYLCENIQGCVLGYTQSDEISLLLIDYKRFSSSAWFDNEVQKICSISASMATLAFNKIFSKYLLSIDPVVQFYNVLEGYDSEEEIKEVEELWQYANNLGFYTLNDIGKYTAYYRKVENTAMFDARCFNIPKEEVANYFYWRQQDATRNSIEMVGQAYFSHKELHKKTCNMIQDILHEQKGINWNDFSVPEKRGSCCIKETYYIDKETGKERKKSDWLRPEEEEKYAMRTRWIVDENIPIFKNEGQAYIDDLVNYIEEK